MIASSQISDSFINISSKVKAILKFINNVSNAHIIKLILV